MVFFCRKRDKKSRRKSEPVDSDQDRSDVDKKKSAKSDIDVAADENGDKSDVDDADDVKKDVDNDADAAEEEERARREKEERIAASLRKREAEVAKELSGHLHARDKEREQHRHLEAVSHFQALLADLIRLPDFSWKEARKILKKDSRYFLIIKSSLTTVKLSLECIKSRGAGLKLKK